VAGSKEVRKKASEADAAKKQAAVAIEALAKAEAEAAAERKRSNDLSAQVLNLEGQLSIQAGRAGEAYQQFAVAEREVQQWRGACDAARAEARELRVQVMALDL
jgi:hypothetical protein